MMLPASNRPDQMANSPSAEPVVSDCSQGWPTFLRATFADMPARRENEIEQADRDFKVRSAPSLKVAVHADFASILNQLERLQRGPDAWEEACLVQALSWMEARLYERAQTAVRECVTPVGERSSWRESQIMRNPRRYTLAQLRRRFDTVTAGLV